MTAYHLLAAHNIAENVTTGEVYLQGVEDPVFTFSGEQYPVPDVIRFLKYCHRHSVKCTQANLESFLAEDDLADSE